MIFSACAIYYEKQTGQNTAAVSARTVGVVLFALSSVIVMACSKPGEFGSSPVSPGPELRVIRTRFVAFGDSLTAGVTSPAFTTLRAGVPQSYPFVCE